MNIEALIAELFEVGRTDNLASAATLPGAGVHNQVVLVASHLRKGATLAWIAALSVADRVAFAKALAFYEHSVGGIGSVTALEPVMRLLSDSVDQGYETFQWILLNTRSLDYYMGRAIDFIEPVVAAAQRAAARAENERQNYELAEPARARRAQQATDNLYNAVRRGDLKAVHALLDKGADPQILTPDGVSLIQCARALGRETALPICWSRFVVTMQWGLLSSNDERPLSHSAPSAHTVVIRSFLAKWHSTQSVLHRTTPIEYQSQVPDSQ